MSLIFLYIIIVNKNNRICSSTLSQIETARLVKPVKIVRTGWMEEEAVPGLVSPVWKDLILSPNREHKKNSKARG